MGILKEILKTTVFIPIVYIFVSMASSRGGDYFATVFAVLWGFGVLIATLAIYVYALKPSFLQPSIVDDKGRIVKKERDNKQDRGV